MLDDTSTASDTSLIGLAADGSSEALLRRRAQALSATSSRLDSLLADAAAVGVAAKRAVTRSRVKNVNLMGQRDAFSEM